jgi:hypothetical protein
MKEEKVEKVEAECSSCRGTGIYRGFMEPKGVGVVCLKCGGTGKVVITYKPFNGRKTRDDVERVFLSKGPLIIECGPGGKSISYMDFLVGKMPPQ